MNFSRNYMLRHIVIQYTPYLYVGTYSPRVVIFTGTPPGRVEVGDLYCGRGCKGCSIAMARLGWLAGVPPGCWRITHLVICLRGVATFCDGQGSHACLHCMHSMANTTVALLHTNTRPHSHSLLRRLCLCVAPKKLIIAKGGA